MKFETFWTNIFYMLVFTPLIVVIEWVMTLVWGLFAYFIFTGTLNVDYASAIVSYVMLYLDKPQTGLLFAIVSALHFCGIVYPSQWLRFPPLLMDVGILCMFAGTLLFNRPIALGSFTAFALAIIIIFSICKAMNVKYTIYQLKK